MRVFPRRTNATPDDEMVRIGEPTLFDECDEVHVSVAFDWDKERGVVAEYVYKTDDVVLPEDAQAFQFQDTEKYGWMPELIGGEWIKEDDE